MNRIFTRLAMIMSLVLELLAWGMFRHSKTMDFDLQSKVQICTVGPLLLSVYIEYILFEKRHEKQDFISDPVAASDE